jgi:hypothetical protein
MADANFSHFTVLDDGQEYFFIAGKEYPARSVGVESLRKFASKNKVKTSTFQQRWLIKPTSF